MSNLFAVADSKISIGPALASRRADFVALDFSVLTYAEIDGWETMGALGDVAETISTVLINRNRVVKQKGTSDGGTMECTFAIIEADAGQLALRAAQDTQSNYAFKIEYSSGTIEYFIALVMSVPVNGGSANTVLMLSTTLEVNSNIVRVV